MSFAALARWSLAGALSIASVPAVGLSTPALAAVSWSGSVIEQARIYYAPPVHPRQRGELVQPALVLDGTLWVEGTGWIRECQFNPYVRYDSVDESRALFDLQAARCRTEGEDWTLSIGHDVEAWGVLEFVNPADVWNQRDLNDDLVSKRKLGRPVAHVGFTTGGGTFDLYASAWFTPLSFPGWQGRLRPVLAVAEDEARFGSSLGRAHPAAALRYGHALQRVQLGASYYYGYRRDPAFAIGLSPLGQPFLFPTYAVQHQVSLEAQGTFDSLLVKMEGAVRLAEDGAYDTAALGVGLEHDLGATLTDGQSIDAFLEYDYDSRQESLIVPFTNAVIGGLRIGLNDVRATELTVWSAFGLSDSRVEIAVLDASTLIFDNLKLSLGVRLLPGRGGVFGDLRRDDHVSVRLQAYF